MAVLGTNSAFVFDFVGIVDNERIVSAAFTVGILLPEFKRRVCGLCPAQRIISLGGSGRSDLPNLTQVVIDVLSLCQGLPEQRTINISVQSAFFACAVVTDGNEHERII